MNASQFRAEPVPPIAPSNYKAPQRREIVDPDNFDPDFQPRAPANFGSSAAAPAAPAPFQLRRPYAPRDRGSGQHRPGFPTSRAREERIVPWRVAPAFFAGVERRVSRATQGDRGPGQHRPGFR